METNEPRKSLLFDVLLPKIEVLAWVLSIVGFIAKWNLISAGNIMLIVGLGSLANVYFLSAFMPGKTPESYGEISSSQNEPPSFLIDTLSPKLANIGGAVALVGTLFKLMAWSGATMMLIEGTVVVLFVVVLLAFNQRSNRHALWAGVIGAITFYTPAETLVRQFHRDDQVLVQKMIYQLDHPRDRAAGEDVRQYLKQKRARR
jgi:hypothetical protein